MLIVDKNFALVKRLFPSLKRQVCNPCLTVFKRISNHRNQ